MARSKPSYAISHMQHARNGRVAYNYSYHPDLSSRRRSTRKRHIMVQNDVSDVPLGGKLDQNVNVRVGRSNKVNYEHCQNQSSRREHAYTHENTVRNNVSSDLWPSTNSDHITKVESGQGRWRVSSHRPQPTKFNGHSRNNRRRKAIANVVTVVCLLIASTAGSFAICKYFLTRHEEQQKLTTAQQTNDPKALQAAEGTDEKKIPEKKIDSYKVAADRPRIITIGKIGVRARILPMKLNPGNSIQAPTNINDTGWYTDSAKPGQAGISLIDGHDLGATSAGIFYKLKNLSQGDKITIEMGDGKTHTYAVSDKQTSHLNDVDMGELLQTDTPDKAKLVLITCDGAVVKDNNKVTQDHRIIIHADLVK